MEEFNYRKFLKPLLRNAIHLDIGGKAKKRTRFGGVPDVPEGFVWPCFDDVPLAFLAQFDCEELEKYDLERLLPETGLLSFFYEMNSLPGDEAGDAD